VPIADSIVVADAKGLTQSYDDILCGRELESQGYIADREQ
jgi:hypothetical protein